MEQEITQEERVAKLLWMKYHHTCVSLVTAWQELEEVEREQWRFDARLVIRRVGERATPTPEAPNE